MATNKLGLTRDQLASFLGDFEQIKQFEKLFSTVDNIDTVVNDEVNISAGTANATANEALALISVLSDQTALLSLAPPDLGGTVTSVGLSGGTTGLTISGPNPITTSGTFIIGGTLGIANGGTGATTAAGARVNLGAAASGANSDITSLSGITGGISTPDYIDFDTTAAPARATGRLWWDNADGIQTLNLGMAGSNATLQIGEEMYFRIKASSAITEGQVVMFTGTVGNSGALTGAPATGLTKDTASYVMGVATEDIALNGWGYVTQFGLVRNINTTGGAEAWVDGQILYYNPAVAGGLTKTVPSAPNAKVEVAAVVKAGTNGSLFVRPIARFSLGQLNDVETAAATNLDLLQYNGGSGYWQHVSPTTITIGTATNLAGGASNRIAYQTGPGATNFITAPTIASTFLEWNGSAFQWSPNPTGSVASVSVVSANGLAGTVANPTTTPAITLSTTVTGIVKGNGTALSAASAGTDYVAPGAITTSGLTMATSRLLGRTTASTGAVEEISVAGGLTLSGGVLTGTSGTVTSVSGTGTVNGITLTGTVTSSGSLTLGGTLSNVSLTTQVTGTLPIANGGTNATTASGARTSLGATTVGSNFFTLTNPSAITFPRINADNSVSTLDAATFRTAIGAGTGNGSVTSVDVSGGTTGLTTSGGPITGSGTITIAGTLVAANGGTGQTSYTIGDILYASGTTTLSKLADVATGNALISGGVGAAPSYGKIGLTTHVSGTLPVANGGTGATTLTSGYVLKGNGTSAISSSVIYDDGTNVGIGTASPGTFKLNVNGAAFANSYTLNNSHLIYSGSSTELAIRIGAAGPYYGIGTTGSNNMRLNNASGGDMLFSISGTTFATLQNTTGNFGVGTTGPAGKIHAVASDANIAFFDSTDTTGGTKGVAIRSTASSGTATPSLALRQWRTSFAGGYDVGQFRFDGLTTSGGYTQFAGIYASASTNTASGAPTSLSFYTTTTAYATLEALRIGADGNLIAPTVYTTVVGATNRDVFVDSSGNIGYVSSIRASKTNIKDLSDTAWLDALRPVTFNYRQRNEDGKYTRKPEKHLEYGLIAEEVVEVNPELVFYDDTESGPELRGVSYSKLIIPLLKEIQSLRARVAKLEGE